MFFPSWASLTVTTRDAPIELEAGELAPMSASSLGEPGFDRRCDGTRTIRQHHHQPSWQKRNIKNEERSSSSLWHDHLGRAHIEKGLGCNCLRWFDIKNYDQNGPEGQFTAASTTMCNAGSPPYYAVFLISAQSVKVSMKKKKKEKKILRNWGGERLLNRGDWVVCARLQIPVSC